MKVLLMLENHLLIVSMPMQLQRNMVYLLAKPAVCVFEVYLRKVYITNIPRGMI